MGPPAVDRRMSAGRASGGRPWSCRKAAPPREGQRMESPIENRIGQVFVPVSDMGRAVAWYSRLLGLPAGAPSHGGGIYDVPMAGETRLALDATKPEVTN